MCVVKELCTSYNRDVRTTGRRTCTLLYDLKFETIPHLAPPPPSQNKLKVPNTKVHAFTFSPSQDVSSIKPTDCLQT
jgi:hypothetical protein